MTSGIPCRRRGGLVFLAAIFVAVPWPVAAEDWPGWRGGGRDGIVGDFHEPAVWPKALEKKWSTAVGTGHASPVVASDRIFQFSRLENQETIACLDMSGNTVWRQQYAAPYEINPAARKHGEGPKSTPLVADGNVYTLGIGGILSCWSADKGQRLWQHDFSKQFPKTSPLYGTATSPLAVGNQFLAYVGGHDQGAMTSFEPGTGLARWQWDQDGPGYSSPIVTQFSGTRQIITQSQKHCIGLSLDGQLLWSIPYATEYDQNIVTPVPYGDTVIVSGYDRGVTAYRIVKDGLKFRTDETWHSKDVSLYMSSPVIVGNRLYGYSHYNKGQLFCLDAATGRQHWLGPARQGENALLVGAGSTIMALTTESTLVVLREQAAEYQELARYAVAETPTWAHPVLVNDNLLVKDAEYLSLWSFD